VTSADYERLTALDVSFLAFEDANVHMHVAAIALFDAVPLTDRSGKLDYDAIHDAIEQSLATTPRFRQKLVRIPVFRYPVWVDDDRFNLEYHVRHTALPAPGDERRLKRLAGRILSQKLDRGKPLWEMWVVEGVEGGRFALIVKAHHCMVDGVGGLDVLTGMLRFEPDAARPDTAAWTPRPSVPGSRLFFDELARRTSAQFDLVRLGRQFLAAPRRATTDLLGALRGIGELARASTDRAADSRLNTRVGPFRRFDWTTTPLSEVSEIRRRFGGTINDVALTAVAGALGEYLAGHGETVDDESFHIQFPVSTRAADDHGTGNRVAMLIAPLPIGERDPAARLRRVIDNTDRVKHSGQQRALAALSQLSDRSFPELNSIFGKLGVRQRPFNVVVTNVPGPKDPVYLLSAQMLQIFPLVPLLENQTLGIAFFSYCGTLQWGFHADWDAVPDLHDLVDGVDRHFTALLEAARAEDGRPAAGGGRGRRVRGSGSGGAACAT
jgi:WS/DGAT/MGAT family acyltransferase